MELDGSAASGTEDGALLSQIAAGGSAALEELSRRYSRTIRSVAYRILYDEGEADEVLQDVLWKIWQRALDYDPRRGSVASWISVMTRRRAIDRLRTRQAFLRAMSQQPRREPCAPPEVSDRELLGGRLRRVRRAFRELPAEQRHVLALAFFHDMSQREIAKATGIPLGTIKTRTNAAKKRLLHSLGLKEGIERPAAA